MDAAHVTAERVTTFLVERYWPGVTVETFTDAARRVDDSVARLRDEGASIRTISSTLVPADEAAYWVVEATSADLVEHAYAAAHVPVERIVAAFEVGRTGGIAERPAVDASIGHHDGQPAEGAGNARV